MRNPDRSLHPFSTIGVVLVALGILFLLQNLGYLPSDTWRNLWRFWPIILILAGLDLVFGRRFPRLMSAAILVIVVLVLWLALGWGQ